MAQWIVSYKYVSMNGQRCTKQIPIGGYYVQDALNRAKKWIEIESKQNGWKQYAICGITNENNAPVEDIIELKNWKYKE